MKNSWILTVIILIIAIIGIVLFYSKVLNINELSAFASIFAAAAGSLIAVVWFYNSLQQQIIQLNEQRQHH